MYICKIINIRTYVCRIKIILWRMWYDVDLNEKFLTKYVKLKLHCSIESKLQMIHLK